VGDACGLKHATLHPAQDHSLQAGLHQVVQRVCCCRARACLQAFTTPCIPMLSAHRAAISLALLPA
jgi:hypothetical protein